MDIFSSDNFKQIIVLLLPGYVTSLIIDCINPKYKYYELIFIFRCFIHSIIDIYVYKLISVFFNINNELLKFAVLLLISFVIGLTIGILKYKGIVNSICKKLNFPLKTPIPTAWDYEFSKHEESYMIVTLDDGTQIKGLYSENSFASDPEYGCDLFLEQVFYKNGDDEWFPDYESKGIYIAKDKIKLIEFKGEKNGRKKECKN